MLQQGPTQPRIRLLVSVIECEKSEKNISALLPESLKNSKYRIKSFFPVFYLLAFPCFFFTAFHRKKKNENNNESLMKFRREMSVKKIPRLDYITGAFTGA